VPTAVKPQPERRCSHLRLAISRVSKLDQRGDPHAL